MTASAPGPAIAPARARDASIDLLRGLVMVVMALDHIRDFAGNVPGDPAEHLANVSAPVYLTRWVTHFCAPVFVLLAGVGAYFAGVRRSKLELSRFLVTRGLWLVVLEVTVVRWGWSFNFDYSFMFLQVIWAIGVSMIVLGLLVHLPLPAIAAIGVSMIVGHNLLDAVEGPANGPAEWAWALLHRSEVLRSGGTMLFVRYPLVPWIGVMAAGYALGPVMAWPPARRRRFLLRLGAAICLVFVVLRSGNFYGDSRPWSASARGALFTFFSFINCVKYPPSLLYLCMTLGPSMVLLGVLAGRSPDRLVVRPLVIFGRVPLFYYLLHVPLLHGMAIVAGRIAWGPIGFQVMRNHLTSPDAEYARWGLSLPVVYGLWAIGLAILYPVCRWFAGVKAASRAAWLSYL